MDSKKIATLTFHWATNYGAVLQAYALQKFLKDEGYQTEIIDYVPARVQMISWIQRFLRREWKSFAQEKKLAFFRREKLALSRARFYSYNQLKKCGKQYDTIICGSDQIWNTSFTTTAEGDPTLSYFLGFAGEQTKRIAYAVSFGTDEISKEYAKIITGEISRFSAVSVREDTGVKILQKIGVQSKCICDPTLLLQREHYEQLVAKRKNKCDEVFTYILHRNQYTAKGIDGVVRELFHVGAEDKKGSYDMYEWLYRIKYAKIVVTNSFHGVMLSLIFNTPFIAIPVEGMDMNNRITTILGAVDLMDRVVSSTDMSYIRRVCNKTIEWKSVNKKMGVLRNEGRMFLLQSISGD